MTAADIFLDRLRDDPETGEVTFVSAGSGDILPYPVTRAVASIGMKNQDRSRLIGDDQGYMASGEMEMTVLSPEKGGAEACLEHTERIVDRIRQADAEGMIISVSLDKYSYDKAAGAFRIVTGFRLAEKRVCGGDSYIDR